MHKDRLEQISSLVDDKKSDQGIIDALVHNEGLRRTWERYHLIRDALQGHLPERVDCTIANRVKARVMNEPALTVVDARRGGLAQKLFKPVSGLAIAASLAAAVVIGLQQGQEPTTVAPNLVAGGEAPGRVTFTANGPAWQTGNWGPDHQAQLRLDHYLVNYNEHRANSGMHGLFPYVRIVAYEAKK